tara:strand:+ start:235 stop:525 length:291 start_codon:yes stop_codon:yes gene_type:complete
MNRFHHLFTALFTALFILSLIPSVIVANGTPNKGKCYNGWHNVSGRCHAPHGNTTSADPDSKRFIKNGGKCFNGWFLDTEKNKCVKSRGLWGWLTD